ncbi:hypothetical protein JRQ81_014312 [Phrynocephalus forsythii]|uniref:Opioid growth factor receptor (OGFr) conserved domain-containing protein n=1 Tax=Phrynocephalus forsythii TaxID=171643 RepID=A0A9Q1B2Q5_9SAUR|nr:hypothetical protein JRQ81_014312 [Phrynocephalus forsythii]
MERRDNVDVLNGSAPANESPGPGRLWPAFLLLWGWRRGRRCRPESRRAKAPERKKEEEEEEEEEEDDMGFSEYDSTWEDEEVEEEDGGPPREDHQGKKGLEATPPAGAAKEKPKQGWWSPSAPSASGRQERRKPNLYSMGFRRCKNSSRCNWGAARDMQKYRRRYPDLEETEVGEEDMWNLSFYKNEIHFKPHGLHIEELLEKWQNDYATLEENHSYIQWLFPLREPGMNWRAKILTCQEIEAFKRSKEVLERFVRAYKLMLGFYGINLINEETGELKRAENWYERFENLNQYSHNNLRITRILKCLGEMGYEHYQVHLVKFFLTETLVHHQLPRVLRSALDYFMFTVRSKQKRRELVHFAWQHFKPKREFVWGPHKKLRRFKPRSPEFLSQQEPKEEQETTSQGTSTGTLKDNTAPPNEISQGLKEEPSNGGAIGDAGKDALKSLNEQVADRTRSDSPLEQPVSQTDAESSCPSNDSTTSKSGEKEPASPLEGDDASQGADVVESQARCAIERPIPSEGNNISTLAPPAETKEEKHRGEEAPPAAPLGEENGNSSEGESLKEAKKRKLEMSRLSGNRAEALKGPTDIEKISFNLEEVVIGPKDVGKDLPVEVQAKPSVPERGSGDDGDVKEVESVMAVIKRRKVEEMTPKEDVTETSVRGDTEVIPLEGQVTNCSSSRLERTEKVTQDEIKGGMDSCTDTLTGADLLVNSQVLSTERGLPVD